MVTANDVEWIVYADGDLGVKIGDLIITMYKGESIERTNDEGDLDHVYRPVMKREFGESIVTDERADAHDWFEINAD